MKRNILTSVFLILSFLIGSPAFAQTVPCVQTDECFEFTYAGPTFNSDNTVTLNFSIKVNCNRDISYAAFGLPAGATALAHSQGNVENPTNNPFYSIKFENLNGKNGAVSSFSYTISAAAFASMTNIQVQAKAAGIIGTVTFDKNGCGTTPPPCPITADIAGPDTVCAYNDDPYTFSTPAQTGATYVWTVPADWFIDAGQGTNEIIVYAGADPGDVTVTVTSNCGSASDMQYVAVDEECGLIDPLPVELVSFTGTATSEGIALNWATASELNNDRFEIQRSVDGRSFETVATQKGNGTTANRQAYAYLDRTAQAGQNYYRLRQVDFDGSFEFSRVIAVDARGVKAGGVTVYPNPSSDGVFNLRMAPATQAATVTVLDMNGRTIHKQEVKSAEVNIDGRSQGMKAGIYLIKVENAGQVDVQKLIVR